LSNNPTSRIPGWCFASREEMRKFLGIAKRTLLNNIERLIEKGIVEREEKTKYLKTTLLWYDSVVIERLKIRKEGGGAKSAPSVQKVHQGVQKVHRRGAKSAPAIYVDKNSYKDSDKNLAPHDGAGKQINDLIDLFKNVNPSWERLFPNKTERKAMERIVKKVGVEKIKFVIEKLPVTNKVPYAPTITTPLQLERKLGNLIAFYQRKKAESESKGIKINTIL